MDEISNNSVGILWPRSFDINYKYVLNFTNVKRLFLESFSTIEFFPVIHENKIFRVEISFKSEAM